MKKNKRLKKLVKMMGACFLIGAVSLSSLAGCAPTKQGSVEDVNATVAEGVLTPGFDVIQSNTTELKLYSSEPVVIGDEQAFFVERTITATVYPLDTPYQEVTWELSWVDASEEEVSDYVTITPNESDSRILTLRCYKAFLNKDMQLVCRTVVGNYTATASVTYYGAPTRISVNGLPDKGSDYGLEYYTLLTADNYNLELNLENGFNCVNPEFSPEYSLEVEALGSVVLNDGSVVPLEVGYDEYNSNSAAVKLMIGSASYTVATMILNDGVVSVKPIKSVESLDGNGYTFSSFINDTPCRFILTIRENVSGIYTYFTFRVISTPKSVSLDAGSIVF